MPKRSKASQAATKRRIGRTLHPEESRTFEVLQTPHPEKSCTFEVLQTPHPEKSRTFEVLQTPHPEKSRTFEVLQTPHPEKSRTFEVDFPNEIIPDCPNEMIIPDFPNEMIIDDFPNEMKNDENHSDVQIFKYSDVQKNDENHSDIQMKIDDEVHIINSEIPNSIIHDEIPNEMITTDLMLNEPNLSDPWSLSVQEPLDIRHQAISTATEHTEDRKPGIPLRSCVFGSFSQRHKKFGVHADQQCVANSLVAVMMNENKSILTWSKENINDVLNEGNQLYSTVRNAGNILGSNVYLLIDDLPEYYTMKGTIFSVAHGQSYVGNGENDEEADVDMQDIQMPLDLAIQRALTEYDACFVTVRNATCVVIKQGNYFSVFDPHSRNSKGLFDPHSDKAVVIHHSNFDGVYKHARDLLYQLTTSAKTEWEKCFEITGVKVQVMGREQESGEQHSETLEHNSCTPNTQSHGNACNDLPTESCHPSCSKDHETPVVRTLPTDRDATQRTSEVCAKRTKPATSRPTDRGKGKLHNATSVIKTVSTDRRISQDMHEVCGNRKRPATTNTLNADKNHSRVKPLNSSDKAVLTCQPHHPTTTELTHRENEATDSVIICDVRIHEQPFKPLKRQDQDALCTRLELTNENTDVTPATNIDVMGSPCKIKSIKPDGNCFYRSLAFSICGNEEKHLKIRRAIARHFQKNSSKFEMYLRDGYTSVQDYVTKSRIYYSGSWATEIDIFAAADLFKTTIMTCNDSRWNAHRPTSDIFTDNCMYLNHTGNHYDVAICVKQKEAGNACAGTCQHNKSNDNLRVLRKRKLNDEPENVRAKKERQQYHNNSDYKERKNKGLKDKYHKDSNFQERKREYIRQKYRTDPTFQKYMCERTLKKYKTDPAFQKYMRGHMREHVLKKYKTDPAFRKYKRERVLKKYKTDPVFRKYMRDRVLKKYKTDPLFQKYMRENSEKQYKKFKNKRKADNKKIYHENENIRVSKIKKSCERYSKWQKRREDIHFAINHFRQEVSRGPEYVCAVCHRLLFRKQVVECKRHCYEGKGDKIAALANRCITLQYLHICDAECEQGCCSSDSPSNKLWICYTCHRKILSGKLPEESVTNNMHLEEIPAELKCLNSLEQHLIARHIPFMKLLCLPRGRQNACHGPCVSVPINTTDVTNILPRNECDDKMIRVKLKKKLTYKGHYQYMFVHTDRVRNALKNLKRNNKLYEDVTFNEEWVNTLDGTEHDEQVENIKHETEFHETAENSDMENIPEDQAEKDTPEDQAEEDLTYIKDQNGLLSDTSLQPVDLGSEILDQNFQDILNVAPGEGNSPVRLLSDKTNEAKCFPVLYPTGGPTFHDDREVKITLARYLNTRLLNADGRFARNTDFIFYAQYTSEVYQVVCSVSVALRKGGDKSVKEVTPDMLLNSQSLRKILHNDEGYKFLRGIRGTPPYWMAAQKDIFAMIRQLSIPTYFASFSSADLRWPEMLNTMSRLEGQQINVNELDWSEKCGLLRRNPVTAARMFDHRWHCFLRDVIMSAAEPIGKIKDYFYRVEFQQRGSPHVHCLFWVENAPKLDRETDAEVAHFIDSYITCEIPPETDAELHETVNSVQKHSTRHSKTCRKKKTICRFNFPRPPSSRTFITRGRNSDDLNSKDKNRNASAIMEKVKSALTKPDQNFDTTDAFFESLGIDQGVFERAYNMSSKKKSIVLKRNPKDIWVNQYNKDLLRAWQGNMDIQYVTDAFSVVVYILTYITKAEQEMGLLLQRAQNEAMNGNLDAKEAFKRLGSVYLHNREVSAQEAVYRLTHMHLKECSRQIQYIPIGENPVRMSLPLHVLQSKAEHEQSRDGSALWMTNVVERYKNRPKTELLENVCLASFCSEYRVLYGSQVSSKKDSSQRDVIKLNNNCGFMKRRTRTEPAVVRYPRFSPTKNPETYFHALLQLFLPYYEDLQLKPAHFDTYEHFYDNGAVKCGNDLQTVKSIVDSNKALFERESDEIDRAKELLEENIDLEDAWAQICPETESERLHCLELMKDKVVADEGDNEELIPDLTANPVTACTLETNHVSMPREDALHLLRSLNEEQSAIFYSVRKWCLQKLLGLNPEPFRLFITGGAGTGKSHLIRAIHYESTRLLSQLAENPDDLTVLLTASTGVAAYNIGAATIHNTFSIGANIRLPYQPLGDEKVNSLRTKMENLQIIIIDEVSMVDHRLLAYVHGRLRQIKQTGDYSPFGKVCIVAVGDFYQLPPVKGTPLFADNKGPNLWENNFEVAELTKVVRQQDAAFAEMLNRLRVRKKNEPLNTNDLLMLKKCETGGESKDIHIFATNAEVDKYNIGRLQETCPDAISIHAQDFVRNPKTGRMEPLVGCHSNVFNSCLSNCVNLGIGARVMLKKNISVSDGLVNGAFGSVVNISDGEQDDFPSAIHVEFDCPNVGKIQRSKTNKRFSEHSTLIEVQEDQVTNAGGVRRQFPLRLAWACTVHKVQGLTVEKAVVSLKKIFTAGQAYVALSRVKTLTGLIIEDFKESTIYCNNKIDEAMKNLPQLMFEKSVFSNVNRTCTLALHNVQSLKAHILDIQAHKPLMLSDCICLTETWLNVGTEEVPGLPGFLFSHNPRADCYDDTEPLFTELKRQQRGGVGMYYSDSIEINVLIPERCNLECLYFSVPHVHLTAAVLYRPSSYKIDMFREHLLMVIYELERHPGKKVIMGDFNEDVLVSSTILKLMAQHGYTQQVKTATTEKGTLIDHVYIKHTEDVIVEVVQTYYSFHEAILISFL